MFSTIPLWIGYLMASICNDALSGYGPPTKHRTRVLCNAMQRHPNKAVMTVFRGRVSYARSLRKTVMQCTALGTLVSFAPKPLRRRVSGVNKTAGVVPVAYATMYATVCNVALTKDKEGVL